MFRFYKNPLKYKIESLLKDRLIHYSTEKHNYERRQNEWKCKVYDDKLSKCYSESQFEKEKEGQIRWCSDEWKRNHYKQETVSEILNIVENL